MNRSTIIKQLGLAVALVALAACAPPPREDTALDNLRADLEQFRANTTLSSLVPLALADAERAVREASVEGLNDIELAHYILIAEKRLEIARASAFRAQAQSEINQLEAERTELLLRASRLEVEQARREAEQARMESTAVREEIERTRRDAMTAEELREEASRREAAAREEAEAARRLAEAQANEIELARREAELATEAADSLRRRLELMELRQTDRGVVVTLGDVLFEVGQTNLQPEARTNLEDVVELLQSEPDKRIRIEGHTDSSGPADVNQRISLERAEAVRDELAAMGIDAGRIQAVGMGEDFPIASNDTADGRSRNRRVDVILLDD
ncbi:OmpA family protein [Wenzhouxiangella marina]|uniref:OmpA/MotB domain-containing protein n=1 Tax=Wenzhouxiangella marina TaxID=1579979 RepID=A0A0K0XYF1_9GAMM|nr:OmpA family protein [Wenzhouxiangella marina]AKS42709.1 OmpA/MotB domain-containing protein [Wenzhouxiangella marina]MBB6088602.1 outer membrane protein OmpA-like peptidoglycan-associated protein [Wenzhouxiangella marina]